MAEKRTSPDTSDKITVHQTLKGEDGNNSGSIRVHAPLPEQVGFGVANEVSSPFSQYIPTGKITQLLYLTGRTAASGISIRKMFTGVQQPDISFEMEFRAYEDAYNEVVIPTKLLLMMGAAEHRGQLNEEQLEAVASASNKFKDVVNMATTYAAGGNDSVRIQGDVEEETINDLIKLVEGPEPVTVKFGRFLTLRNCLISSVNAEFSTVLDFNKIPMHSKVSMTVTPRDPIYKSILNEAFKPADESAETGGSMTNIARGRRDAPGQGGL